jgi:flagellar hook assembly protein FlgD
VTLRFTLPAAGSARLEIFDVAGRQVWLRQMGALPAGPHSVAWDGRDSDGRETAAGVYLVRLTAGSGSRTARVVRLD